MTFPTTSIFSRKCCFRLSFIRIMYNYFLKNSKKKMPLQFNIKTEMTIRLHTVVKMGVFP